MWVRAKATLGGLPAGFMLEGTRRTEKATSNLAATDHIVYASVESYGLLAAPLSGGAQPASLSP